MAGKNKKELGQHWLKDRGVLTNIAMCAKMGDVGTVLEIGPGLGTLTSALFLHFPRVVAVEFDEDIAGKLMGQFPGKELTVVTGNVLDVEIEARGKELVVRMGEKEVALPEKYVVAGNIPYYITAPIVRKFLTMKNKPAKMALLVQKEVAERLAGGVGEYSILGLSAQIYAKVSLGPTVERGMFTPPPKVDSQVVIFEPYDEPLADEDVMRVIVRGFKSPRKKLKNNLELEEGILTTIGADERARPADLTIDAWKKLAKYLHKR